MPNTLAGRVITSPTTSLPALWLSGPASGAKILELDGSVVQVAIPSGDPISEVFRREGDFFIPVERCPLCNTAVANSRRLAVLQQLFWQVPLQICNRCGLLYKLSRPNSATSDAIYAQDYSHFCTSSVDCGGPKPAPDHRILRLGAPHGRRHLDVGCGAGGFVSAARAAGFNSFGVDPFLPKVSKKAAAYLVRGDIRDLQVQQMLGQFDVITLWSVWEHLIDPLATVVAAAGMLRPDGLLLLNSPNGGSLHARLRARSWSMATLVEHFTFLTPTACRYLAGETSLTIERLRHCGSPFPMGAQSSGANAQGLTVSMKRWVLGLGDGEDEISVPARSNPDQPPAGLRDRVLRLASTPLVSAVLREVLAVSRIGDHIELYLRRSSDVRAGAAEIHGH